MINVIIDTKSVYNKTYIPYLDNQSRFLNLYGGRGSGKSVFAGQKCTERLLDESNHSLLVLRKVGRTNRHSTWSLLKSIASEWKVNQLFHYNNTELYSKCVNGSEIICAGLDDVEKLKSIPKINSIWIEEATELTRDDLIQVNLLLRGQSRYYKQIILTYNPISALHWLKDMFFDHTHPNTTILKTTWRDNRFLDEEYIKELEYLKEQNYQVWAISSEGEWGILEDLIYTNWKTVRSNEFKQDWDYIGGIDFGYIHPSVLVKIHVYENNLYLKQLVYEKRKHNVEFIKLSEEAQFNKSAPVYADSEAPGFIDEFYNAGFNIYPAEKGKGSVNAAIDMIKRYQIKVTDDSPDIIKELQTWSWKRDKNGDLTDVAVDLYEDAMKAMGYAMYNHYRDYQIHETLYLAGRGRNIRSPLTS